MVERIGEGLSKILDGASGAVVLAACACSVLIGFSWSKLSDVERRISTVEVGNYTAKDAAIELGPKEARIADLERAFIRMENDLKEIKLLIREQRK